MAHMQVLPGWIDYNGHMTESRYYFANSETVDAFLRLIGAGMDYVAAGHSYYSAETHIRHLGEAKLGERLVGTLQIISADEKRFRSFVRLLRGEECVATVEQICLHVDMQAGKAVPARPRSGEARRSPRRMRPCPCPRARAGPSARRGRPMDFGLTEEQRMIVETTRPSSRTSSIPHEAEVERTGRPAPRADPRESRPRPSPPGSTPPTCRKRSAAPGSIP